MTDAAPAQPQSAQQPATHADPPDALTKTLADHTNRERGGITDLVVEGWRSALPVADSWNLQEMFKVQTHTSTLPWVFH